jgi:hypothetical protein
VVKDLNYLLGLGERYRNQEAGLALNVIGSDEHVTIYRSISSEAYDTLEDISTMK